MPKYRQRSAATRQKQHSPSGSKRDTKREKIITASSTVTSPRDPCRESSRHAIFHIRSDRHKCCRSPDIRPVALYPSLQKIDIEIWCAASHDSAATTVAGLPVPFLPAGLISVAINK